MLVIPMIYSRWFYSDPKVVSLFSVYAKCCTGWLHLRLSASIWKSWAARLLSAAITSSCYKGKAAQISSCFSGQKRRNISDVGKAVALKLRLHDLDWWEMSWYFFYWTAFWTGWNSLPLFLRLFSISVVKLSIGVSTVNFLLGAMSLSYLRLLQYPTHTHLKGHQQD